MDSLRAVRSRVDTTRRGEPARLHRADRVRAGLPDRRRGGGGASDRVEALIPDPRADGSGTCSLAEEPVPLRFVSTMSGYASFDEKRIKHLEMIQSAIVRLSSAAIQTKRWSFVLSAALLALAVQQQECLLGAVSVVIAFGLWVLDHDFLRSEQLFRKLYEHAA